MLLVPYSSCHWWLDAEFPLDCILVDSNTMNSVTTGVCCMGISEMIRAKSKAALIGNSTFYWWNVLGALTTFTTSFTSIRYLGTRATNIITS